MRRVVLLLIRPAVWDVERQERFQTVSLNLLRLLPHLLCNKSPADDLNGQLAGIRSSSDQLSLYFVFVLLISAVFTGEGLEKDRLHHLKIV